MCTQRERRELTFDLDVDGLAVESALLVASGAGVGAPVRVAVDLVEREGAVARHLLPATGRQHLSVCKSPGFDYRACAGQRRGAEFRESCTGRREAGRQRQESCRTCRNTFLPRARARALESWTLCCENFLLLFFFCEGRKCNCRRGMGDLGSFDIYLILRKVSPGRDRGGFCWASSGSGTGFQVVVWREFRAMYSVLMEACVI